MIEIINPANGSPLRLQDSCYLDRFGNSFPFVNGAVRLVQSDNYTASFGFQWNKFAGTQIDGAQGELSASRSRLLAATGWDKEDLSGKNVLEAGSGAGRFSRAVLEVTQAELYSFDYSDAVSANFRNNGHYGNRLHLFQASIYEMPFREGSFDKVFCFGVLQHTPNFEEAIKQLAMRVKPGGELVVDFYPINGWWTKLHAKYMLRPLAKRLSHETLLRLISDNVDWLTRLYFFFQGLGIGKYLNRFLPLCDITATLPQDVPPEQLREMIILDTFDMFSPAHDHPQRLSTVRGWFEKYGLEVTFAGLVSVGPGRMPIVKGRKVL